MSYLIVLIPLPFLFLTRDVALQIFLVFISLIIFFYIREAKKNKSRGTSDYARIQYTPQSATGECYEYKAGKKIDSKDYNKNCEEIASVNLGAINLSSVDITSIKTEALNAEHHEGNGICLDNVDITAIKSELSHEEIPAGKGISLDSVDITAIKSELSHEEVPVGEGISLDSVDVESIKAQELERFSHAEAEENEKILASDTDDDNDDDGNNGNGGSNSNGGSSSNGGLGGNLTGTQKTNTTMAPNTNKMSDTHASSSSKNKHRSAPILLANQIPNPLAYIVPKGKEDYSSMAISFTPSKNSKYKEEKKTKPNTSKPSIGNPIFISLTC